MADRYARFRDRADQLLGKWRQGTVRLTQTVSAVKRTYELNAAATRVRGGVDGTTILATDGQVVCGTLTTLVAVNGVAVTPSEARVAPQKADSLLIDGKGVTIIKVEPRPGAGTTVAWRIVFRGS